MARSSDATLVGSLVRQAYLNRTYAFNAELEAKISAVTPEMAKAALNKYVTPENLVVVRAGTFGK
ncbi:hypothetical protein [Deinococcus sp. SM5_A1]|uniref:hypothetical protein n=1 Tax=Deinococcus sp. SM5_A1 TaxID=3379094 RepID=UPI00386DDE6D